MVACSLHGAFRRSSYLVEVDRAEAVHLGLRRMPPDYSAERPNIEARRDLASLEDVIGPMLSIVLRNSLFRNYIVRGAAHHNHPRIPAKDDDSSCQSVDDHILVDFYVRLHNFVVVHFVVDAVVRFGFVFASHVAVVLVLDPCVFVPV